MITIERYIFPAMKLYNSDNELLTIIFNEHELNQAKLQIIEQELSGYYLINLLNGHRIEISKFGVLSDYAHIDAVMRQYRDIVSAQCKMRKKHNDYSAPH